MTTHQPVKNLDPKFTPDQLRQLVEDAPKWVAMTEIDAQQEGAVYKSAGYPVLIRDLALRQERRIVIHVQAQQYLYPDTGAEEITVELIKGTECWDLDRVSVEDAKALAHALLKAVEELEGKPEVPDLRFDTYDEALSYAIGQAMEAANVTLDDLAEETGVEWSYLANCIAVREPWVGVTVLKVAKALEVSFGELVATAIAHTREEAF